LANGSRNATSLRASLAGLERPWVAALIALTAYGAFASARLHHFDFDPSSFVVAGDVFVEPDATPSDLLVQADSAGYDGQFFYRLALDPFTTEKTDFGIRIDAPAYRQQRILYPLITWALTRASSLSVPATLILVNWLGLGAIAFLAALLCQHAGRHPLWGLVIAGHPGFLFTLARDLSEITAAAFVLGGLVLWQRKRLAGAALAFTLAVLARETALLVPIGISVGIWIESRSKDIAWLFAAAVAFGLWQLALANQWGVLPFEASNALAAPFTGMAKFVSAYIPPDGAVALSYLAGAAYLSGIVAVAAISIRGREANRALSTTWALYLALATVLSWSVWIEDIAFLRATTELQIFSVLLIAYRRDANWSLGLVGAATAALWLAQAAVRVGRL